MDPGLLVALVAILWAFLSLSANKDFKAWLKGRWGRPAVRSNEFRASAPRNRLHEVDPIVEEHASHVEEQPECLFPWFVPEWGGKCYEDFVISVYAITRIGQKLALPEFREISPPREGLIIIDRNFCYDYSGKLLFEAAKAPKIFRFVSAFREGMALISDSGQTRFGFVDRSSFGVVVPMDYREGHDFYDGVALVRKNEQWGFIDPSASFIALPANADQTSELPTTDRIFLRCENRFPSCPARDFREGLAAVVSGKLWGYIDKQGNWVIQPAFKWAGSFSGGLAAVRTHNSYSYINTRGETVIAGPFTCARRFSEGLAPVRMNGPLWGLIDRTGTLVVEPRWASVEACSEGIVTFTQVTRQGMSARGGLYHVASGSTQILERIAHIGSFSEGLAVANRGGRSFGYLNMQGEPALDHEFGRSKAAPFYEGLALVETEHF